MTVGACSVIIVNFRNHADTIACLDALEPVMQTVVVDNASGDGSVPAIRNAHPDVRIVERPSNDGFGAGVNAGAAAAEGDVLIVLNPDTRPHPGALGLLSRHLRRNPGCGVAAPTLVTADGSVQPSMHRRAPGLWVVFCDLCAPIGYVLALRGGRHPSLVRREEIRPGLVLVWASGAALAFRREAFEAVDGFDEEYFLYFEEVDLQLRIAAAGFAVEAAPEAVIEHRAIGDADHPAPPPHWLGGARRFLGLRGVPAPVIEATFALALLGSRIGLRLVALARPSDRDFMRQRARAFDELARARRASR